MCNAVRAGEDDGFFVADAAGTQYQTSFASAADAPVIGQRFDEQPFFLAGHAQGQDDPFDSAHLKVSKQPLGQARHERVAVGREIGDLEGVITQNACRPNG
ncbi:MULTISPECIES: hypothetical protein [Micrococcaceae]|uniref:hypothetical protein n=1 Tax=Micrococcaceae TaxID=1268 RepID=UPI0006F6AB3B|nr:hypothetical protein [Arthrobacter sp. Soil761]KRE76715.1 hypothetical protein ASG79_17985 [Arthrobacter sp. Soil761]